MILYKYMLVVIDMFKFVILLVIGSFINLLYVFLVSLCMFLFLVFIINVVGFFRFIL